MGRDKRLLMGHGSTLLDSAISRFRDGGLPVCIAGTPPDDAARSRWSDSSVSFAADRREGQGPLGGLESALLEPLCVGAERIWIAPCDTPRVPREFYDWLDCELGSADWIYPVVSGVKQVLLAVARPRILEAVRASLDMGRRSVEGLVKSLHAKEVCEQDIFGAGFAARDFANINTPEDYELWCREASA